MTIITNARFPGSTRRVDIAIKGGRDCGNHARRLPDLGDGNRRPSTHHRC